ncbi:lipoprotein insertase outer membrane protein LolB [Spiribacter vilamensis]|uniref:Outer-membrane lipoprotein LolB n=1 Tax=Spiribacter vilamensis TaxID=531306 RepID=A0A4Q8CY21_9GAMM|nr:lipoprotein insertase outer membrane protein LolB [Spiribacter vilamensis]RZU97859.1 outer membrane lipoprotein LolB [Spiribacter vilamensis]TVO61221.1 outer membrane lipoprotein LolB [Spiribacter vilamensis]
MKERCLFRASVPILLCVLLTACAVRSPQPDSTDAGVALATWEPSPVPAAWRLNGRTSLRLGDEGATATVSWDQSGREYRIDLRGALGAGSLRITGDGDVVRLTTSDGERYTAESPRELVRAVTGYDLPVSFLRYWVTGRPVPWLDGRVIPDPQGRPSVIHQDGWRVTYETFRAVGDYHLPERVAVVRGDMSVRIAIGEWESRE